jgi:hypothetical protein
MPGLAPLDQPTFPTEFLDQCREIARRRAVPQGEHQRARLVLLLHESPVLSNVAAGSAVDLHPNSVRLWRRRWAQGGFSLVDQAGRGRKPVFPPPRPGHCQGRRVCGCLPHKAATEPTLDNGLGSSGRSGSWSVDQPQHRLAHPGRRRHQAMAVQVLDLPSRPPIRRESGASLGSIRWLLGGAAAGSQGLHH